MRALTMSAMLVLVGLGGPAWAAPPLPDDARLAPARQRLEERVGRAEAAGLPAELLVAKVREGLAKGVDVARIEAAVGRLHDGLQAAARLVSAKRPGAASASLVRAVAEARLAGVSQAALEGLVVGQGSEDNVRRAVEVLTELALRGYPSDRTAALVRDVLTRDAAALGRLPATLDSIRTDHALTYVEATDALARGLASADSLQAAYGRTVEDERRKGSGSGQGRKEAREAPGKSGLAPGQLKPRPPTAGKKR